MDIISATLT